MKTLVIILGIATSAVLFACTNIEQKNKADLNVNSSKVYAREPNDSTSYKHLKYNFYLNKSEQLYERKLAMAKSTTCNCIFEVYYDSNYTINTGDTIIRKPLNSVVDLQSFVWLDSTEYSKDKNYVYFFYNNSDGGNRTIVQNADPATFQRLCEYRWGIDKTHVFYENRMLEGIRSHEIQVLHSPDTVNHFVDYIKDDRTVFYTNQMVLGADAKTFKISSGHEWEAEDKNFRYEAGRRKE